MCLRLATFCRDNRARNSARRSHTVTKVVQNTRTSLAFAASDLHTSVVAGRSGRWQLWISQTFVNTPGFCEYPRLLWIATTPVNIPTFTNIPHFYEYPRSLWISPTSTNPPNLCEYPRLLAISPISVNNSLRIVPISPATCQHQITSTASFHILSMSHSQWFYQMTPYKP